MAMDSEKLKELSALRTKMNDIREAAKRVVKAAQSSAQITNNNWIIVCGEFAIEPEIIDSMSTGRCQPITPHTATRFSEQDAVMLASTVYNGCNDRGKAVLWLPYTIEYIEKLDKLISQMDEVLDKHKG